MRFYLLLSSLVLTIYGNPLQLAPIHVPTNGQIIPNEYLVTLVEPSRIASIQDPMKRRQEYSEYVDEHLQRVFGQNLFAQSGLIHKYELGYAAVIDKDALHTLRGMPEVMIIEANQVVSIFDEQKGPLNWGLDRISHRDLPLTGHYDYSEKAGEGVDVYVVDTGINIAHEDFEGRAIWGLTAPQGDEDADGNGHGTHVASTIAGKMFGVSKKSTVIAVKVLRSSGYGSMADVIKGVQWTAEEHTRKSASGKKVKSVANMSLGGGKSLTLDMAVTRAIAQGVMFAVAAGNDNRDACKYSPARAADAVTVGASTREDERAFFSNWGTCVDVFAPGHQITAAWIGSKTATKTISGTSMASPHVAGVLALLAAEGDYTPAELKAKLLELATLDKLSDIGKGSPNKLLFSNPPSTEGEGIMNKMSLSNQNFISFRIQLV